MTIKEIEAQFESEWILVADSQTNEALEVLRGNVICHSKDRDEGYRRAVGHRLDSHARKPRPRKRSLPHRGQRLVARARLYPPRHEKAIGTGL